MAAAIGLAGTAGVSSVTPVTAGAIVAAMVGLTIGSFLNVCIYRLPRTQSVVRPRSRCPSCANPLGWWENIPVLSYVLLRGRCRRCGAPISPVYPAVELATALLFAGAYLMFGLGWLLVARLFFGCAMIVLFVIDLQHRILPNIITLPGIGIGFLFSLVAPPGWVSSLIGIVAGAGIPLFFAEAYYRIRGEQGLGMGDVKMLAMIGAFLGWPLMLLTLMLSSFLGSLAGLAVIALKKGDLKYALPYGTFLAVGGLVAGTAGTAILRWYVALY